MEPRPLVVVVDDDPELRAMLTARLGAAGWDVITANNGEEALALGARTPRKPSVIVLDLMMPVMDADAFLQAQGASELLADVPVIITTAVVPVPRPAMPSVRAVLAKPFSFALLTSLLRHVIANPGPTPPDAPFVDTDTVRMPVLRRDDE